MIAEFAEVFNLLKDRVWEERLVPIKDGGRLLRSESLIRMAEPDNSWTPAEGRQIAAASLNAADVLDL